MKRSKWRRTRIVCTIGPASGSDAMLRKLIQAGMDVARLNLSHGTQEEHAGYVKTVRRLSAELGRPVSVLMDLPGPKYRIGSLKGGRVRLRGNADVALTEEKVEGDASLLPLTLPGLSEVVRPGQTILLDDGALQLRVLGTGGATVRARVIVGGLLIEGKGVVVPGAVAPGVFMTGALRRLAQFAAGQRPDHIALSFVSGASDVQAVRSVLVENGADIPLIAKIERRDALRSFDVILRASDGIMVARGDLGVEIPLERVPLVQKDLIARCNRAGKPVITATEMLQSMVSSVRPVRAEVTDVANAVFDGTDAVMLSAETSIGQYPVQAVKMMDRIAVETEKALPYEASLSERRTWVGESTEELIAYNACLTAHSLGAKAIVAFTQSGSTAGRVAKYRPRPPILAITPSDICSQLALHWGVLPVRREVPDSISTLFSTAADLVKSLGLARTGDLIVVTGGIPLGEAGTTNLLKVEKMT